jgi:hypothetical protein
MDAAADGHRPHMALSLPTQMVLKLAVDERRTLAASDLMEEFGFSAIQANSEWRELERRGFLHEIGTAGSYRGRPDESVFEFDETTEDAAREELL